MKQTREISLFYIYLCTHMPRLDLRHTHRYVVRRTPISILMVLDPPMIILLVLVHSWMSNGQNMLQH